MKRAIVLSVTSLGVILVSCGEYGGVNSALGAAACPELAGGAMNARFEADARANATIKAFVTASGDLAQIAGRLEAEVGGACERIGRDLGVPPEQMQPREGESRVVAACRAADARIDGILRSGVNAQLRAQYTPPQCQVSAQAEAACRGECAGHLDPGYIRAHCQPGHLYGRCDGTCSGHCTGACQGQCQGQTGAGGQCSGTCNGRCTADCHGSCSVEIQEPKCDVAMQGPSADIHCDGSCRAHADLTAQCTRPQVRMTASVNAGEIPRLVATLEANLPALLEAELAYGQRIAGDIDMLARTGSELPRAFGQLTAHAGACIAAAANATFQAQASIRVSVQASASIDAKAGTR